MAERESNFKNAMRVIAQSLCCPECGECNRPGRSMIIELQSNGIAYCGSCSKTWTPKLEDQ